MASSWRQVLADCDRLYRESDFARAVEGYTHLLCLLQDTPLTAQRALTFNNRGHAKYMMVDFYAANEDFDEAIKLDPTLAVAYYNRGTIQYRMGEFQLALQDFKMSTKLEPSNAEFSEGLASCEDCLGLAK